MRWAVLVALSLAACGDGPKGARGGGPLTVEKVEPQGDAPQHKALYREAFEEAKKEITLENAEEKLEALEKLVIAGE